jgi:hypothetical protein
MSAGIFAMNTPQDQSWSELNQAIDVTLTIKPKVAQKDQNTSLE